jgi:hypothetical protein
LDRIIGKDAADAITELAAPDLSSNGRAQAGGGYTGVGVSVGTTQPHRWVEAARAATGRRA